MLGRSLLGLLIFLGLGVNAQVCSVNGIISDLQTGETLIGATVILDGSTTGASSDINGQFCIDKLTPGVYRLRVSYIGYLEQLLTEVKVEADKTTTLAIALKPDSRELKTTEITAARITNTENAVLAEMRKADQVVNGVSSQQIAKSQDRAASDVMRRIPGVTVVEDKFIMVRGLSDRYNVVMLNDAIAPSLEPDRKSFSFDLIPSGLLDRIMIYKTGAPELPGEFAGGAIKIFTKNIPDENITQLNYYASYRTSSTGETFYRGNSGRFDWLGMDGNERALPSSFPKSLNTYNEEGSVDLPQTWTIRNGRSLPDQRFNFLHARSFKIAGMKAGSITSIAYSTINERRVKSISGFNEYQKDQGKSEIIYDYTDSLCMDKASVGIISNWSLLASPRHKFEFHNMFNQSGTNSVLVREGPNYEAGSYFRNYAIRYNQRKIYTTQLSGDHEFNENTHVNWVAGVNLAATKDPDYRRAITNRPLDNPGSPYSIVLGSTASLDQLGRFFSAMDEQGISGGLNVEHTMTFFSGKFKPKIRTGIGYEGRERRFDARWMSYIKSSIENFNYSLLGLPVDEALSPGNINSYDGFKLAEGTNPYDKFNNSSTLFSGYAGISIPFTAKLNLSGGVRVEDHSMTQSTWDEKKNPLKTELKTTHMLPSVNLSYNTGKKSLIRAAYFKSVNRPEFREIERYSYFDFMRNEILNGNPDLKTAEVDNIDLRWEYYRTEGELITIGGFSKNFKDPIERYTLPGVGGGTKSFYFDNAEKSTSVGAEIELRKSLQQFFTKGMLSRISLTFNASYIFSKVDLGEKVKNQDATRPMMDQSPYMVNGGLFYSDFDHKLQANVLYNVIGRRLFAIGTDQSPDIYEMPRHLVDLNISKGINKHLELKAGVKDVLNNSYRYMQDVNNDKSFNGDDQTLESYSPGRYFTLGASWNF